MSSTDLKLINSRGKRYTCPRHPTASVALGRIRTHTCILEGDELQEWGKIGINISTTFRWQSKMIVGLQIFFKMSAFCTDVQQHLPDAPSWCWDCDLLYLLAHAELMCKAC